MRHAVMFLTVLFLLSSCSSNEVKERETALLGAWTLIKTQPPFAPTKNYEENMIIWTFNDKGEVNIAIADNIVSNPIKPSGKYDFFTTNGKITIDDMEFDYRIENDSLIFSDDPASDGIHAIFLRMSPNY